MVIPHRIHWGLYCLSFQVIVFQGWGSCTSPQSHCHPDLKPRIQRRGSITSPSSASTKQHQPQPQIHHPRSHIPQQTLQHVQPLPHPAPQAPLLSSLADRRRLHLRSSRTSHPCFPECRADVYISSSPSDSGSSWMHPSTARSRTAATSTSRSPTGSRSSAASSACSCSSPHPHPPFSSLLICRPVSTRSRRAGCSQIATHTAGAGLRGKQSWFCLWGLR